MTALYETPVPDPIAQAIARAESRGPFADGNHVVGDIAGAALKAVRQIDRGEL